MKGMPAGLFKSNFQISTWKSIQGNIHICICICSARTSQFFLIVSTGGCVTRSARVQTRGERTPIGARFCGVALLNDGILLISLFKFIEEIKDFTLDRMT